LEVVEAVEEAQDCTFACSAFANEGYAPAARDFEGDVVQCGGLVVVGEGYVFCGVVKMGL
jgi:uncharacterized Zn-binding protein involved in type VI secretion